MIERDKYPVLIGKTYHIATPCGKMYVTVNRFQDKIVEIFAKLGKAGGCPTCQIDVQARLISVSLQHDVDIQKIIKQLIGNKCPMSGVDTENIAVSCPDALGKIIQKEVKMQYIPDPVESIKTWKCPECGKLVSESDPGYPSYGSECSDCKKEEEDTKCSG